MFLENLQRMHHRKELMNLIRTPMNGSTSRLGQKLLANKYQIFILHPENEDRALLFLKYLIFLHQKDTYYQSKELHELFEAPQEELLLWRNQSMKK